MFQIILLTMKPVNQLATTLFFYLSFRITIARWNTVKISSHSCGVSKFQQFLYIHFGKMKLHLMLPIVILPLTNNSNTLSYYSRVGNLDCVYIVIGQQDYTAQLAACSSVIHQEPEFKNKVEEEIWRLKNRK